MILGTGAGSKPFFRYDGSPDVQKWDVALSLVAENFSPVYRSGFCFLAHPDDGRLRPESAHGAQDELPGLCRERFRLRNRAQRSKGNTFDSHAHGPFDSPAESVKNHHRRLVLLAVTDIRFQ